jgi:hypothetical protein
LCVVYSCADQHADAAAASRDAGRPRVQGAADEERREHARAPWAGTPCANRSGTFFAHSDTLCTGRSSSFGTWSWRR